MGVLVPRAAYGPHRLQLILLVVASILCLSYVTHLNPVEHYLQSDSSRRPSAVGAPPSYDRLRKWEDHLPQHNLSLPLPEGRHGRYVKFSSQIKMLGWNNVLNEVYV